MSLKKYLIFPLVFIAFAFQSPEVKIDLEEFWNGLLKNIDRGQSDLAMEQLDSLYQLSVQRNDTFYLIKFYETAGEMAYYHQDYEKSLAYCKANLKLVSTNEDYGMQSLLNARIGNIQRHFGRIDSAFIYVYRAKNLLPKIDRTENDYPIIYVYNDLAMLHVESSQIDSSIYYYLELLNITPPTDSFRQHTINMNISGVFRSLNNTEKEEHYLNQAFKYCDSDKFVGSRAGIMGIQAAFYRRKKEYHKALDIIDEAIALQLKHNKRLKLNDNYLTKASILIQLERYNEASKILDDISELEKTKNKEVATSYFLNKLILAIETNESRSIPGLLAKTKTLVTNLSFLRPQLEYYGIAAKYYKKTGNYKMANDLLEKYTNTFRELTNLESIQIAKNLESEFEFEKNNLKIAALEEQELLSQKNLARQRYLLLGGGLVLGVITFLSFFLFGQNNKIKSQKGIIEKALAEKDTLLREIHHRVKNNLQLVSSLLTLQSRSITDESAIAAINDGKARVRSMALIHQNLYNRENLTGISVRQYVQKLCNEIFNTYNIQSERITLELDIQELELDVDTVVPLGLIINELLTNSLKYAFPNEENGKITIKLSEKNQKLEFELLDNGIGMDEEMFRSSGSFGNRLVRILAEQLEGKILLSNNNGTRIKIIIDHFKLAA